jgi:hypothetical protein
MPFFKRSKQDNVAVEDRPDVSILNIQKAFDNRSEHRNAEHLRVIYSLGESTGEVRASITWEALAQLRQEMERAGKAISERGVLDFVLLPWIMEKLQQSHGAHESPPDEGYELDFGPAPAPREVRGTLIRYGLLPT